MSPNGACFKVKLVLYLILYNRILQHEYAKNRYFAIGEHPELAQIFTNHQNRRVTVPNPVVDQFFADSLEFGIPMVQTDAGIFARPRVIL